jgi:hypothetical protein
LAYTLSHPEIVSCASLAAVIDPVAHGKGKDKLWKENGVKYVPQRKNKSKNASVLSISRKHENKIN